VNLIYIIPYVEVLSFQSTGDAVC